MVCGQMDAPATFPNYVYMYIVLYVMDSSRSLCIRKATYNSKCRIIALWPAGIIENVNVARTI
jgi:hypothetical protein